MDIAVRFKIELPLDPLGHHRTVTTPTDRRWSVVGYGRREDFTLPRGWAMEMPTRPRTRFLHWDPERHARAEWFWNGVLLMHREEECTDPECASGHPILRADWLASWESQLFTWEEFQALTEALRDRRVPPLVGVRAEEVFALPVYAPPLLSFFGDIPRWDSDPDFLGVWDLDPMDPANPWLA